MATKTMATIMLVAMLAMSASGVATAAPQGKTSAAKENRQLQRLYRKHDRKLALRASVLGVSSDQLREKLKVQPFETVVRQAGFKSQASFQTAVIGKMKDELRQRGWSDQKIQSYVAKQAARHDKPTSPAS